MRYASAHGLSSPRSSGDVVEQRRATEKTKHLGSGSRATRKAEASRNQRRCLRNFGYRRAPAPAFIHERRFRHQPHARGLRRTGDSGNCKNRSAGYDQRRRRHAAAGGAFRIRRGLDIAPEIKGPADHEQRGNRPPEKYRAHRKTNSRAHQAGHDRRASRQRSSAARSHAESREHRFRSSARPPLALAVSPPPLLVLIFLRAAAASNTVALRVLSKLSSPSILGGPLVIYDMLDFRTP